MKADFPLKASAGYLIASSAWAGLYLWLARASAAVLQPLVFSALFIVCSTLLLFGVLLYLQKRTGRQTAGRISEKDQLQLALDSAGECLWEWQLAGGGTSIHFSCSYCAMLGYTQQEFAKNQQEWQRYLHPDEREHVYRRVKRLIEDQHSLYENTYRMQHKDGSYRWIHSRGRLFVENGKPVRMIGIAADITANRNTNERLRLANAVFDNTREGVLVTDINNIVVFVNPAFSKITGYTYADIVGNTPRLLRSGRHSSEFYADMWQTLNKTDHWSGEIWNRRKNGEILPQLQTITQLRDEHGLITHRVAVFSDISLLRNSQNELSFLAHYDPLTSLPNRTLLHEHLKLALQRAMQSSLDGALFVVDLDHFKTINESLGHACGDELLKSIISRIQKHIDSHATLSRFGGDEFAVVMDSVGNSTRAASIAEGLLQLFHKPFQAGENEIFITASVGICLFPESGKNAEEVFRNAETALSQAKQAGRNTFAFYSKGLTETAYQKLQLANELRQAIEQKHLEIHFQPVHSLLKKRIVGCEALVRWLHPERGMIPPLSFISTAEDTGLIGSIDGWVLQQACEQMCQWQKDGIQLDFISVNISSRLFGRKGAVYSALQNALHQTGLDPECLELEITENAIMADSIQAINQLQELRKTGVRLAIDDFGTGYSSLGRLKFLPVDKLKIDQTFVNNLPHDPSNAAIIRAIMTLGESLRLAVQAEGVETREQADFLMQHQCVLSQGYLFGKPLSAAEFRELLDAENSH